MSVDKKAVDLQDLNIVKGYVDTQDSELRTHVDEQDSELRTHVDEQDESIRQYLDDTMTAVESEEQFHFKQVLKKGAANKMSHTINSVHGKTIRSKNILTFMDRADDPTGLSAYTSGSGTAPSPIFKVEDGAITIGGENTSDQSIDVFVKLKTHIPANTEISLKLFSTAASVSSSNVSIELTRDAPEHCETCLQPIDNAAYRNRIIFITSGTGGAMVYGDNGAATAHVGKSITTQYEYTHIRITIKTGAQLDKFTVTPMVVLGNENPPVYHKYFPGLVNSSFKEIRSIGKNLFDGRHIDRTITVGDNVLTYKGDPETGRVTINGTKGNASNVHSFSVPGFILPAGTYTISLKVISGTLTGTEHPTTGGKNGLVFGINGDTSTLRTTPGVFGTDENSMFATRIFTLTKDTIVTTFDFANYYLGTYDNLVVEAQLEVGEEYTGYEPYKAIDTMGVSEAVQLGEWDAFDPKRNIVDHYTYYVEFDGSSDEDWRMIDRDSTEYKNEPGVANMVGGLFWIKPPVDAIGIPANGSGYADHPLYEAILTDIKYPHAHATGILETIEYGHRMQMTSSATQKPGRYYIRDKDYSSIEEWRKHLQALKEAGTPLTVAYRTFSVAEKVVECTEPTLFVEAGGNEFVVQDFTDTNRVYTPVIIRRTGISQLEVEVENARKVGGIAITGNGQLATGKYELLLDKTKAVPVKLKLPWREATSAEKSGLNTGSDLVIKVSGNSTVDNGMNIIDFFKCTDLLLEFLVEFIAPVDNVNRLCHFIVRMIPDDGAQVDANYKHSLKMSSNTIIRETWFSSEYIQGSDNSGHGLITTRSYYTDFKKSEVDNNALLFHVSTGGHNYKENSDGTSWKDIAIVNASNYVINVLQVNLLL